jgi:hypothetical protein
LIDLFGRGFDSLRLHELFYKINIIFKNILDLNS